MFQAKTGKNKYIQLHFYSDKISKKSVIFICNDPFLLQSSRNSRNNDSGNKNISKKLRPKQKPAIAELYNKHIGHVDVFHAQLKKYTVSQKVGNRADNLTHWLKKSASYFLIFLF